MLIKKKISKKGNALIAALIFIAIFLLITGSLFALVTSEVKLCRQELDSIKAFYLAEAGIERGIAAIRDGDALTGTFSLSQTGQIDDSPGLDNVAITITSSYKGESLYEVEAYTTVGEMTRTVKANVMFMPPSKIFDYAYFTNNWGWFYGSGITANGDVRSNGRFDFKYEPRVEGEVYAGQGIGGGGTIKGKAGKKVDGEYIYQHPYSSVLEMPNLQDLSYYETLAQDKEGTVKIDGVVLIDAVFGDEAGESGNIVLIGTPSHPIELDGPVVVTKDVVITGTVDGQGTIYAGRNIYLAGDISYKNAPSSPRPASDNPDVVDQWVEANKDKDLIGLAASENIVLGDYTGTTGGPWYANYYLFGMGNEDVGEDGIPGTKDAGEGDGIFQSQDEDLDGDGLFDDNYSWSDITTHELITTFSNVPEGVESFGDLATNNISKAEGIFYTNHAFAGRVGYGVQIDGGVISKDEAIVYRNTLMMNYDERVHSKYRTDPNWLIDLKLPSTYKAGIVGWWEE